MDSQGKVAIITGAGTGIGNRTALALMEEGYSVVLGGRRAELLEATAAEAGHRSYQALVVPTDVTDVDSVRNLFARTKEVFGRLERVEQHNLACHRRIAATLVQGRNLV